MSRPLATPVLDRLLWVLLGALLGAATAQYQIGSFCAHDGYAFLPLQEAFPSIQCEVVPK